MLEYFGNSHLYTAFELQRMALSPVNMAATYGKAIFGSALNPLAYTEYGRRLAAGSELLERMTHRFGKPEFGIAETKINGETIEIDEVVVLTKVWGRLLHFQKRKKLKQKKLLIVAPMSGHYATLLRGTVQGFLPHFDVFITDWQDAREVPVYQGRFDLDDYINYLIEFLHFMGENSHIMAVCQPAVPVLAAVSIMSSEGDKFAPATMTLIGGPIDTRINPTEVNEHGKKKSIEWFKHNVISLVPMTYPGAMRPVYPGFVQLTGFMTMNLDRHVDSHVDLFNHLVAGDGDSADSHKKFYNEYLSVMDICAEFYLQTVETVFQKHLLPRNQMVSRGRKVLPKDIKKTALLCIEGEKDDISGVGQTAAALELCSGLPAAKKLYHLQKDVGHYGQFNGKKFREQIVPVVVGFADKHS